MLGMLPVMAQQTPCALETGGTYSSKLNTLIYAGTVTEVIHAEPTLFTIAIKSASNTYRVKDDLSGVSGDVWWVGDRVWFLCRGTSEMRVGLPSGKSRIVTINEPQPTLQSDITAAPGPPPPQAGTYCPLLMENGVPRLDPRYCSESTKGVVSKFGLKPCKTDHDDNCLDIPKNPEGNKVLRAIGVISLGMIVGAACYSVENKPLITLTANDLQMLNWCRANGM